MLSFKAKLINIFSKLFKETIKNIPAKVLSCFNYPFIYYNLQHLLVEVNVALF